MWCCGSVAPSDQAPHVKPIPWPHPTGTDRQTAVSPTRRRGGSERRSFTHARRNGRTPPRTAFVLRPVFFDVMSFYTSEESKDCPKETGPTKETERVSTSVSSRNKDRMHVSVYIPTMDGSDMLFGGMMERTDGSIYDASSTSSHGPWEKSPQD